METLPCSALEADREGWARAARLGATPARAEARMLVFSAKLERKAPTTRTTPGGLAGRAVVRQQTWGSGLEEVAAVAPMWAGLAQPLAAVEEDRGSMAWLAGTALPVG